ncbi:MaoC family dehydratase N-terminal domain-containing protein [Polycladomyces sp. WAk]|uniref:MaoC family dehydratase N-terminal domain-containing protein n=1 Tax=Polycladomyces zharkentensis TaxID=2807616 RepID=A0ABS2WIV6_9BACL|nr:MaoC/PaaZ C-terminal domain-containing protein [Polycladomyces sp. WAk]MBN2909497.1 MaoC family dehydratase N-terminal domain-containing protein [Polycladomyces sp. WAk]
MKPVALTWQKGQELPAVTLPPVTRLQLIKYAGASGDFNPIHTIDEAAEQAGLPGVIAHGMLTMATMARLFTPYLDQGFIQRFYTRFAGMVFVGDALTISGKVVETQYTEEGELVTFDVFAKNQKGQVVAKGSVDFLVFRD